MQNNIICIGWNRIEVEGKSKISQTNKNSGQTNKLVKNDGSSKNSAGVPRGAKSRGSKSGNGSNLNIWGCQISRNVFISIIKTSLNISDRKKVTETPAWCINSFLIIWVDQSAHSCPQQCPLGPIYRPIVVKGLSERKTLLIFILKLDRFQNIQFPSSA